MTELGRIYTSDFKSIKGCDELQTVNLSRHPPQWYRGISYPSFYPPEHLIVDFKKHNITSLEYTTVFIRDILDKLDMHKVLLELLNIAPNKDIILCCWGKCHDYCHRHLVASYINTFLIKNSDIINMPYIKEITLEDCHHVSNSDYDYNQV